MIFSTEMIFNNEWINNCKFGRVKSERTKFYLIAEHHLNVVVQPRLIKSMDAAASQGVVHILYNAKQNPKVKSIIWYPASIRLFERSILMRLHSPVDLTGNVNMIEKLVLGGTWNRGPPDPQPDAITSAPSSQNYIICAQLPNWKI